LRKNYFVLTIVAVVFLGLLCGMQVNATEKIKLSVWDYKRYNEVYNPFVAQRIKQFEAKYPNVVTEYVVIPYPVLVEKYAAAIESGNVPNVAFVESNFISVYQAMGVLVDLSSLMEKIDREQGPYFEALWANATIEGKQWAIPYEFQSEAIYYRKDLLREAGVSVPDTWQEVREVAKKVNDPSKGIYGAGVGLSKNCFDGEIVFRSILWGFGAKLMEKDGKTIAINSPEGLKAFTFITDWYTKDKTMPPGVLGWDNASDNKAFLSGQVAMIQNAGSVLWNMIDTRMPILENTGIAKMPAGPAGRFMPSYSYHYLVFKQSADVGLAKDLIEFLLDRDYNEKEIALNAPQCQPVFKGMENEPIWKVPRYSEFLVNVQFARQFGYAGDTTPAAGEIAGRCILAQALLKVVIDGWTPKLALDWFEEKIEEIYAKH